MGQKGLNFFCFWSEMTSWPLSNRKSVSMQPVSSSFSVLSRPSSSIPYRWIFPKFSPEILFLFFAILPFLSFVSNFQVPGGISKDNSFLSIFLHLFPTFTEKCQIHTIESTSELFSSISILIPLCDPFAATTRAKGWCQCPDITTTEAPL